jgi:hypothetical protein
MRGRSSRSVILALGLLGGALGLGSLGLGQPRGGMRRVLMSCFVTRQASPWAS